MEAMCLGEIPFSPSSTEGIVKPRLGIIDVKSYRDND